MQKYFYTFLSLIYFNTQSIVGQDWKPFMQKVWNHNQQMQAKYASLQQAESSLKEARAMYFPQVDLGISYTLAAGGRVIDFPIGDLLNPVYSTLNNITQTNNFPQLENQEVQFFPNNFYDAHIRLQQAIYYPDLAINKKVQHNIQDLRKLELLAMKRQLSKESMQTWFQYKSCEQQLELIHKILDQIQEVKRSTQSLIKNGMALPSALLRIESEESKVIGQQLQLEQYKIQSQNYLRYLGGDDIFLSAPQLSEWPDTSTINPNIREEILQIDKGISLQKLALKKETQQYYPKIGAILDLGSQDFDFQVQPYALFGLNLEMNLANFGRNKHRKQQIQFQIENSIAQKSDAEEKIKLQQQNATIGLHSAVKQALANKKPKENSELIWKETQKKYREGIINYVELTDALSQWNQAEIKYALGLLQVWQQWAEYMYSHALIGLE